jgi:hypothetical protein
MVGAAPFTILSPQAPQEPVAAHAGSARLLPTMETSGLNDHEFTMSLAIRHPDIDPALITRELGLEPGHVWRRGEQRTDDAGMVLRGNHRDSYWLCEIAARPKFSGEQVRVESELSRVLKTLQKSIAFLQNLHHGGGATELLVTVFARGDFRMELLPEETALLGRIGLSIIIDIKSGQMVAGAQEAS